MTNEETYFPFELSLFQKVAVQAIKSGEHCLVTAHTGSGKTVPAEFAIQYFTAMGKRVIYTSPIKALSNQKLYDFRAKYPHISFGIVTGDIEDNKEAQVLIMTTEILSNSLLNKNQKSDGQTNCPEDAENAKGCENAPLRFNMDYDNDLAAVVFDEVHYIGDSVRGQAWEQSMMLLPKHVIFVMLSATIANPYTLINWVEQVTGKLVRLSSTTERVVPLKHYVYTPSISEKKIKNMPCEIQCLVREYSNELTLIKEGEGQTFDQYKYSKIYNVYTRNMEECAPNTTIPELIKKLRGKDMLPVLVFVFSRNQTEVLAEQLCASGIPSLFTQDETAGHDISRKIEKECRHMLSKKIPNFDDFLECGEFRQLMMCVGKGIAYHHAGMLPILREIVEFLDGKGYIKVLFATETFAVGVNMPTRTVVFTSLTKYTEEGERMLLPHEYTQMAGRAGRRGLDDVGHCIILSPALCMPNSLTSILTGKPVSITSNYRISYHLVLGCLREKNIDYNELLNKALEYSHNSLSAPNQISYINRLKNELLVLIKNTDKAEEQTKQAKTPIEVIERFKVIDSKLTSGLLNSKMSKTLGKERYKLCQEHFYLERDYEILKKFLRSKKEINEKKQMIRDAEDYLVSEIQSAIYVLINLGFIEKDDTTTQCSLTNLGRYAMSIYEAHPLGLPMYLNKHHKFFKDFTGNIDDKAVWLAQMLSLFCDIRVNDYNSQSVSLIAKEVVSNVENAYNVAYDVESEACGDGQFYLTQQYDVQGVLFKYVDAWCRAKTTQDCKEVIWAVNNEIGISTGDFIKSIMKIVKLSKELMSGAEATNNLVLASICSKVPEQVMKYLATTRSLYV